MYIYIYIYIVPHVKLFYGSFLITRFISTPSNELCLELSFSVNVSR